MEGGFAEIRSVETNDHGLVAAVAKVRVRRIIE
jgi:hypothetical protein